MQNDQKNLKGLSFAYRISSELIAAVIVGVLLGLFLDKLLGHKTNFLNIIDNTRFFSRIIKYLQAHKSHRKKAIKLFI